MTKQQIVVIDDEPDTVDMLKQFLELFEFDVTASYTGTGGMQLAIAMQPQAIILDLMLPDADGFQICRLMRHHANLRKTPILILSARVSKDDEAKGLASGATTYLRKPIDLNRLIEEVRRAIATGHVRPVGVAPEPASPDGSSTRPGGAHEGNIESEPTPVSSKPAIKKRPATLHIPGLYIPRDDAGDKKEG